MSVFPSEKHLTYLKDVLAVTIYFRYKLTVNLIIRNNFFKLMEKYFCGFQTKTIGKIKITLTGQ